MSRKFRVVYIVGTNFRLMETSTGEPATWRMNMEIDGVTSEIEVQDIVRIENEIPTHLGLCVEVVATAPDIDTGVQAAGRLAETIVSLLSAAARASAPPLQPVVAYDITLDVAERPFIQWFQTPDLPRAKTPVPCSAFQLLFEQLPLLKDERLAQRIRLSIDWHRAALRETDAFFRFINLWTALEAIANPLAQLYLVEIRGWHGLRRLAEDEGYEAAIVSEVLDVRRHILHDLSVRPADVRPRAQTMTPIIEHLLVAGWVRLLGAPQKLTDFPKSAMIPYPMQYIVRALLVDEDASRWGSGTHPHFLGELVAKRIPATEPGSVTVTYSLNARPQNFQRWRGEAIALWGPSGPNIPKVHSTVVTTTAPKPTPSLHPDRRTSAKDANAGEQEI